MKLHYRKVEGPLRTDVERWLSLSGLILLLQTNLILLIGSPKKYSARLIAHWKAKKVNNR
jgi:hypothetical protein